jgi:hypothetical protein
MCPEERSCSRSITTQAKANAPAECHATKKLVLLSSSCKRTFVKMKSRQLKLIRMLQIKKEEMCTWDKLILLETHTSISTCKTV